MDCIERAKFFMRRMKCEHSHVYRKSPIRKPCKRVLLQWGSTASISTYARGARYSCESHVLLAVHCTYTSHHTPSRIFLSSESLQVCNIEGLTFTLRQCWEARVNHSHKIYVIVMIWKISGHFICFLIILIKYFY